MIIVNSPVSTVLISHSYRENGTPCCTLEKSSASYLLRTTGKLKVIHAGSYLFARAAPANDRDSWPVWVRITFIGINWRERDPLRTSSFSQSGVDAILHQVSTPGDLRPVFKECQVISKLPLKLEFYSHPLPSFVQEHVAAFYSNIPMRSFAITMTPMSSVGLYSEHPAVEYREVGGKIWFQHDGEVLSKSFFKKEMKTRGKKELFCLLYLYKSQS